MTLSQAEVILNRCKRFGVQAASGSIIETTKEFAWEYVHTYWKPFLRSEMANPKEQLWEEWAIVGDYTLRRSHLVENFADGGAPN